MKTLFLFFISLIFLTSNSCAQVNLTTNKKNVKISRLKLTIFKNSQEGRTHRIYYFNKKKIRIYDKPFPNHDFIDHLHTIHKYSSEDLFLEVSKLNLDSLNGTYFNYCVDTTKGKDYSIIITTKSESMSTTLHHYYLKGIEDLITLVNKYLTNNLRIQYLDKGLKQDCTELVK